MPLHIPTFKTRALTAIVFVLVMLIGLLWSDLSFFLLFTVIHFGCWFEYQRLMGQIDPAYRDITSFHRLGVVVAGWSLLLFSSGEMLSVGNFNFSSLGFWMGIISLFLLPVIEMLFARHINLRNIRHSALGLLYISCSLALLIHLRSGGPWLERAGARDGLSSVLMGLNGYMIPLIIIASIWINDTMAYIAGSLIGRTPLSAISPKKTIEGTLGGILLSVATVTLLGMYLLNGDPVHYLSISLIAAVAGTLGDLFESKIKRAAGVKDSGTIMPGHGGFLDRFDSLLFAAPAVWIYVMLFMR